MRCCLRLFLRRQYLRPLDLGSNFGKTRPVEARVRRKRVGLRLWNRSLTSRRRMERRRGLLRRIRVRRGRVTTRGKSLGGINLPRKPTV